MDETARDDAASVISVRQFSQRTGISERKCWSEVAKGNIRSFRIDGRRYTTVAEMHNYIARQFEAAGFGSDSAHESADAHELAAV